MIKENLPKKVIYILEKLESHGYRADIVGGPVRDFFLGVTPADYDFTTEATPEEIKAVFSDERTLDTGIKHGTVSVVLEGEIFEITTYRVDGEYTDSRHPESVTFTRSIEEDLIRRDFTMNAVSFSLKEGVTDPYGGREDIEKGIIRAVGDPYRRFTEDALRILRGVRFASKLGFKVEEETKLAMFEKKKLLDKVSKERIYSEMRSVISGKFAYEALEEFSCIITGVIPELSEIKLPDRLLFEASDYDVRLISLFALSAENPKEDFETAMTRLKTDSAIRKKGVKLLEKLSVYDLSTEAGMNYLLKDLGTELSLALIDLEIVLGIISPETKEKFDIYLAGAPVYNIAQLKIRGDNLEEFGIFGRKIGETLEYLLDRVIDGEIENDFEALCNAVKTGVLKG